MPSIDFTDAELQQLIQIVATGSGPGINWVVSNGLLQKFQAAAQAKAADQHENLMTGGAMPPAFDATTRPLEPPHRRRANSEDR